MLPGALAINIPYLDFWRFNPRIMQAHGKAEQERVKTKRGYDNWLAWMNGIYIQHAIGACLDSKCKYPSEPIDLRPKPVSAKQGAEMFSMLADRFNQQMRKKHNN